MGPHCVTNWWKLRNNRWIITHTCNYIYLYVLIMYGMHTYTVHLLFKNHMGMDQYLLIPFLGGWTSIYQLFWCSPGVQGFDTLQYDFGICTHVAWILNGGGSGNSGHGRSPLYYAAVGNHREVVVTDLVGAEGAISRPPSYGCCFINPWDVTLMKTIVIILNPWKHPFTRNHRFFWA